MENIDDLISRLAQDGQTVKSAPHPFVLSLKWMGVALIYLVVLLAIFGVRPDWADKLQNPLFATEIAALLAVFATTTFAAALLVFPDIHQKGRLAFAPLASFMLFVLAMYLSWQSDAPPASLPVHGIECTLGITVMALLPSIWTFYFMRNYASTHCRLAGSVALLSSFSIGALWLRLYEVNDSILHVIEWHYLPMLVIGIIGLLLGKKILKW